MTVFERYMVHSFSKIDDMVYVKSFYSTSIVVCFKYHSAIATESLTVK